MAIMMITVRYGPCVVIKCCPATSPLVTLEPDFMEHVLYECQEVNLFSDGRCLHVYMLFPKRAVQ